MIIRNEFTHPEPEGGRASCDKIHEKNCASFVLCDSFLAILLCWFFVLYTFTQHWEIVELNFFRFFASIFDSQSRKSEQCSFRFSFIVNFFSFYASFCSLCVCRLQWRKRENFIEWSIGAAAESWKEKESTKINWFVFVFFSVSFSLSFWIKMEKKVAKMQWTRNKSHSDYGIILLEQKILLQFCAKYTSTFHLHLHFRAGFPLKRTVLRIQVIRPNQFRGKWNVPPWWCC